MKCLSVKPPWAGAIMVGGKNVENRRWNHRPRPVGPLLIHASLVLDSYACSPAGWPLQTSLDDQRGVILGFVDWYDTIDNRDGESQLPWAQPGGYCFLLRHPMVFLAGVAWRGQLGIYDVPDEVVADAIASAETPAQWAVRREMAAFDLTMDAEAASGRPTGD
jgi:hypothetical protein